MRRSGSDATIASVRFDGTLIFVAAWLGVSAPAAASAEAPDPICADRPGQGNSSCTVPAGMIQFETTFVDWTRDQANGERTDALVIGETAIKLGLTSRADIELIISPYNRATVRADGERERAAGFGDVTIRAKYRLTADSSPVQATLLPFVKIPTAKRALGNGKVEGGIAVPIQWAIPESPLSLTFGPELDLIADGDGHGHHLAMVQLAGLGVPLSSRLSVSADVLGAWDWDPAGTTKQYTAGASAAWLMSNDVQLDAGINLGLNRAASDVQVYGGIALRF
ncbi:MAG TPA: transporter [Sphingomicrobium sp.]|nr:transporter [Sphingomicrobium sp.]